MWECTNINIKIPATLIQVDYSVTLLFWNHNNSLFTALKRQWVTCIFFNVVPCEVKMIQVFNKKIKNGSPMRIFRQFETIPSSFGNIRISILKILCLAICGYGWFCKTTVKMMKALKLQYYLLSIVFTWRCIEIIILRYCTFTVWRLYTCDNIW